MFLKSQLLYLFTESPLHVGAGSGVESIDLPIQRERVSGYPLVASTGIKGALRSEAPVGDNSAGFTTPATVVFGPDQKKQPMLPAMPGPLQQETADCFSSPCGQSKEYLLGQPVFPY